MHVSIYIKLVKYVLAFGRNFIRLKNHWLMSLSLSLFLSFPLFAKCLIKRAFLDVWLYFSHSKTVFRNEIKPSFFSFCCSTFEAECWNVFWELCYLFFHWVFLLFWNDTKFSPVLPFSMFCEYKCKLKKRTWDKFNSIIFNQILYLLGAAKSSENAVGLKRLINTKLMLQNLATILFAILLNKS